jgi:GABA permease
MEQRRRELLIVANETACGDDLRRMVTWLMDERPTRFTLVVPATPPRGTLTWTESGAATLARGRLSEALAGLRASGAEVRGWVGDARPLDAVADALRAHRYDAVVVSTLASGVSRWLHQGLVEGIRRTHEMPVIHVSAERGSVRTPSFV